MTNPSPLQAAPRQVEFLSLKFDVQPAAHWREQLFVPAATEGFDYLVTPNVDHLVRLSRELDIQSAYLAARWCVCDSRILNKLAIRRGLNLQPYPGSDMVSDLFHDPRARKLRIAVIGPTASDFALLCERFPKLSLTLVKAPIMQPSTSAWETTLCAAEATGADIHLLCISFPKQEFFAHALKTRGKIRGLGMCVGASIDFLTGQQKRAPQWMQRASLEWAYRLLSNPKRLWKRYLIDAPKIFSLYLRDGK